MMHRKLENTRGWTPGPEDATGQGAAEPRGETTRNPRLLVCRSDDPSTTRALG